MKYFKFLILAIALVATPSCGLLGAKDASGMISNAAALAFDGAAVALQVLDQTETDYLNSLAEPTPGQIAVAAEQVARLQRARDAMADARTILEGNGPGDIKSAVALAVKELLLVSAELQADGMMIPPAVLDGLDQAAKFAGVK